MQDTEVDALVDALAVPLRLYCERVVQSLEDRLGARLEVLEQRSAIPGEQGPPGEPGEPGEPGPPGRDGQPGREPDPTELWTLVCDAVAAFPKPKDGRDGNDGRDGRDVDPDAVRAVVVEEVGKIPHPADGRDGADGKDGRDGADYDPDVLHRAVVEEVAKIPPPQDGRSVTVADVAPLVTELVTRAVAALPVPRDGVGLADAVIDRHGALVLTMTDGSVRALGQVVGRDVDMAAVQDLVDRRIVAEVAKIPPPKDGKDGLGFKDMDVIQDGRKIVFRFALDEQERTFELFYPVPLHRGIWREGQVYEHGDTVTWAGSLWHANANTPDKPGDGSQAWTLVAKRGRDGKDGRNGKDGERGPPGRDGRVA